MKPVSVQRMELYEVGYKGYYREMSEHFTEHIRARGVQHALESFSKKHQLPSPIVNMNSNAEWWEGEWLMKLRYVHRVRKAPCPHCEGTGEIKVLLR